MSKPVIKLIDRRKQYKKRLQEFVSRKQALIELFGFNSIKLDRDKAILVDLIDRNKPPYLFTHYLFIALYLNNEDEVKSITG